MKLSNEIYLMNVESNGSNDRITESNEINRIELNESVIELSNQMK